MYEIALEFDLEPVFFLDEIQELGDVGGGVRSMRTALRLAVLLRKRYTQIQNNQARGVLMKRLGIIFVYVLIVITPVAAQFGRTSNEAEVGVGLTASIFASYVSANVSVVHKPEFFGIGGGAKAMIGIAQRDLYVAPYGRLELGWLYFGVGPLFAIQEPDDFVQLDGKVSFFSTLGFGIPIDSIANGKLILDFGVDASITPSPILVADSGNPIADLFATIIVTALGALLNAVKVNVGLGYAAGF